VSVNLRGVDAQSSSFALVPGDNGTILRWDGSTWSDVVPGQTPNFFSITLVPGTQNNGWSGADNSSVYQWNGNGFSNAIQLTTNAGVRVRGVDSVSNNQVWAVTSNGDNRIYFYNGSNWNQQFQGPNALNAVYMVNASSGVVVGDGGALMTFNGSNWTVIGSPSNDNMHDVDLLSATEGWAVGDNGRIWRLFNGSWTQFNSGTSSNLFAVYAINPNEAWAVGQGIILRYTVP
jgi:photosystem II stability/assembly factor-like uncharacterized protein